MLLGAAAGCGVGAEPPVVVAQLTPAMAYSGAPLTATIAGTGFRPSYHFDTGSGATSLDVDGFSARLALTLSPKQFPTGAAVTSYSLAATMWESVGLLTATIPGDLPAGGYDLIVTDPRGHQSRLPAAFTSLGVDTTPPVVAVASPSDGAVVGAGAEIAVVVTADDGLGQLGGLRVTFATSTGALPAHDCLVASGASTASCPFTMPAPEPAVNPDTLVITAQASGSGGLTQEAQIAVQLVPAPVPTGISPDVGSTLGGTPVMISGANFVPGATTVAFDGAPGTVYYPYYPTATTITVLVPPHAPGAATVTLTTGGATTPLSGTFTYLAPPLAREVSPTSAPASGLVPIAIVGDNFTSSTAITFDDVPLLCPILVNANRIEGYVPPGVGNELVTAYDPVAGEQPDAGVPFLYLAPPLGLPDGAAADGGSAFADGGCPGGGGP
jgi:IPT/TIG domain